LLRLPLTAATEPFKFQSGLRPFTLEKRNKISYKP
jgi:hypothetical protein